MAAAKHRTLPFTVFTSRILGLTLTKAQRALARVAFDGVDPKDLEPELRDVGAELFGGAETVPEGARGTIVLRCGRASGKSTLAAAFSVYRMVTGDVSSCGPGDEPALVVISPRLQTSRIAARMALAMVEGSPQLRAMVRTRNSEGFTLERADAIVRLLSVPKSRGGAAARGYSMLSIIIDESEFVSPTDNDAAVSDSAVIGAVMPRLMAGGSLILASTPWPAPSATATYFEENFGRPGRALAARAPTAVMRDHDPQVVAMIAAERARDPMNALREFDCIATDAEGAFFDAASIDAAVSPVPIVATKQRATSGIDLAFRTDSSAHVIVERQGMQLVVPCMELLQPAAGKPLVPSEVLRQFAGTAREHGCDAMVCDSHYIETAREHARAVNMQLVEAPSGNLGRERMFTLVRDLLREGKLVLPNDPRLLQQLKSVLKRAQPGGGLAIILPRIAGAGHADLVSALVNACYLDRRHGPLVVSSPVGVPPPLPRPFPGLNAAGASGGFQRW